MMVNMALRETWSLGSRMTLDGGKRTVQSVRFISDKCQIRIISIVLKRPLIKDSYVTSPGQAKHPLQ